MQHIVHDIASLAKKILARLAYFLQDGFYWDMAMENIALAQKVQHSRLHTSYIIKLVE